MINEVVREYSGEEFINEMENKYGSIGEAERLFEETKSMKIFVDIRNWKYYKNNLNEKIKITEIHYSN